MPTFDYVARNKEGKKVHGQRVAQSSDLLAQQLLKDGVTPVNITVQEEVSGWLESLRALTPWYTITADDLAMFSRQMVALLRTGVPVSLALRQIAENANKRQMSIVLNGVVSRLESGNSLSSSMQHFARFFNPVMISMIRVGESGGRLDESFLRLSQYFELEGMAAKKAKTALRYPSFVLLTLVVAFVVVTGWVIPTFARVFTQAHISLPFLTQCLMAMGNFMSQNWLWMAVFGGFITGIVVYYLHTPDGQYRWGRLQLRLPVIGKMLQKIILLRFSQTFSVIIAAGVPLLDGIVLSSNTTDNAFARGEILSLRASVSNGLSLTSAIAASDLFTPLEVQMLGISEQTGRLSEMFDEISSYYRREVEYDLKRLSDIMEPVILLALAALSAMLAFSVYLPVWNMVQIVHS